MVTNIIYKHLARAPRNYLSINIDSTIYTHKKRVAKHLFIKYNTISISISNYLHP